MRILIGVVVLVALVVGLLYMQGIFDPEKIGPGRIVAEPEELGDVPTGTIREVTEPVWSEAVGTVRSRRTARVSPRIMGTLLEVTVVQGDDVTEGDVVARIDDREVGARLSAANADLREAQARLAQAQASWDRYRELFEKGATTKEQLEAFTATFEQARAASEGAEQAVRVAEIGADYAEIRAPLNGVVTERLAEPGDLALPGRPILVIQDPTELRLEANVREYLAAHLDLGTEVQILFGPPLDERHESQVVERSPEADPSTRTFLVKASIPSGSKSRPGNFGRLRFRTGESTVVLVPEAAVRRIGQLETVKVVRDGRLLTRHIRTGRRYEAGFEVLSGIEAGETVVTGR